MGASPAFGIIGGMISPRRARPLAISTAIAAAICAAGDAGAVTHDPGGVGQALIFPYYTVQSAGGNAFNTYISIVNRRAEEKAVRVRFREGRASREVLSFNLFLARNDVWTGALVPSGAGTRLISMDVSCTDPPMGMDPGLEFRNTAYSGVLVDGFGEGLDRTREGFVEVLEMATLTGASADAVLHRASGAPAGCALVRPPNTPEVARPVGGLSGTLTLINVNSGLDFTVNAEALAELASRPYYRPAGDAYPDFAAAEIDPVSAVVANGQMYRSVWSRPVDAVSAALMRSEWITEYVLDQGSASLTDVVLTLPTRHLHAGAGIASAPFSAAARWAPACERPDLGVVPDERIGFSPFDREGRATVAPGCPISPCPQEPPPPAVCAAAAVGSVNNGAAHLPVTPGSAVLGSVTRGLHFGGTPLPWTFQNGWIRMTPLTSSPLVSLPASTRVDLATGQVTPGAHRYAGLPSLGFTVRTFRNGALSCTGGTCQGNYGGAFPLKYLLGITPPD